MHPAFTQLLPGAAALLAPAAAGTGFPENTPVPGKIKAWYADKSFGFITPDIAGPDIFVHKNQLLDALELGAGLPVVFQARFNPGRGKYEVTNCQITGTLAEVAAASSSKSSGAAAGGSTVQDNLFIAGMPATADDAWIREFFGNYGEVSQCKILPDQPGKNDKAALVRFNDESKAKWIVENLNGAAPDGLAQPLIIRYAGDRGGGAKLPPTPSSFGAAPAAGIDARASPYGAAGLGAVGSADLSALLMQSLQNPLLQGLSPFGALGQVAPASTAFPLGQPLGTDPFGLMGQSLLGVQPALLGQPLLAGQPALGGLPAVAPLPTVPAAGSEWLEAKDPATNKPYYYHAVTREVRWDKPS